MKSKDRSIAIGKAMHLIAELADTAKKGNDAATIRATNAAIDHIGQSIDPPKIPHTKAQLWRRVARLAGELSFCDGANVIPFPISDNDNAAEAARELIRFVRSMGEVDGLNKKRHNRIITKLEAALKAWEECPE